MAGAIGTGWREAFMGGSPQAERAILADVLPSIERIQDIVARRQSAEVRRAFHNKGRPLAIEYVVDAGLPAEFALPFLREGVTYRGFARFSRSQSFHAADGDLDQRGFAFRIETDAGPQDVLLSNTPVSFARDPVQFLDVARRFVESPKPIAALRVIRAMGLREGLRVVLNLIRVPDRSIAFTSLQYWSRTPFAFGDSAARLTARPVGPQRRVADKDDPDFLSTDLAAELIKAPQTFELVALPFVDDARTPIEDASRPWPESVSRPVVLGRVTLLRQDLASAESVALAERVERLEGFNPFTSPGLRPIGRTNRARQQAYARSTRHRGAAASPAATATSVPPIDAPAAPERAEIAWQPGPGVLDRLTARAASLPHRAIWGGGGAFFAALFAFWMFFLPWPMSLFAWDVHPRLSQVFIGAGYIFRTAFFLNAASEPDWRKLRWIVVGNLAFTGTLLFATYWHMAEFHWHLDLLGGQFIGHVWLILYVFEPVVMLYLIPRGAFTLPPTRTGGPLHPLFRAFLIGTAMVLLTNGLMLVINPEFAARRWPWDLTGNGLDARIIAAWFLGWAFWCGSMARARDWDEIRTPARLFVLNGVALLVAFALNGGGFRDDDIDTPEGLVIGLSLLTAAMTVFHWQQERRRPARVRPSPPRQSAAGAVD